jgi:hypothetical protein
MNYATELTTTDFTDLTAQYNEYSAFANMNPANDLTPATTTEVAANVLRVFANECEYVIWGLDYLGAEAICCERGFNPDFTAAEAISEILEQSRMIITYNVNGRIVQVVNQLEQLIEYF